MVKACLIFVVNSHGHKYKIQYNIHGLQHLLLLKLMIVLQSHLLRWKTRKTLLIELLVEFYPFHINIILL